MAHANALLANTCSVKRALSHTVYASTEIENAKRDAAKRAALTAIKQKEAAKAAVIVPADKAPTPSRSKYVTYGLTGGAGLMLLIAIGGQLQAVQVMQDANAMSFGVDDKFQQADRDAKKTEYNNKVADASQRQGSALLSAIVGLGLGGWAAYRLRSPDPGVASTKAAANTTGTSAGPAVSWEPLFSVGENERTMLGLRGRF